MSNDRSFEAFLKQLGQDNHYLIPKNVRSKFEIFTGFGWRELFLTLLGLGLGFLITFLLNTVIELSTIMEIILVVIPGGLCCAISIEDPRTGLSMLSMIKAFKDYSKKPKKYYYYHGKR